MGGGNLKRVRPDVDAANPSMPVAFRNGVDSRFVRSSAGAVLPKRTRSEAMKFGPSRVKLRVGGVGPRIKESIGGGVESDRMKLRSSEGEPGLVCSGANGMLPSLLVPEVDTADPRCAGL